MENNNPNIAPEEEAFSIRDFLVRCGGQWQWFVGSLIFCLGLGIVYVARQEPVFERYTTVMIKDEDSNPASEITAAFSSFGFGGTSSNVNNELIAITSPSIMFEVVKRLDLQNNYNEKGYFHPVTLYGSNNPIQIDCPDLGDVQPGSFYIDLNPDGSFKLHKFVKYVKGQKEKFDDEVSGRLGFDYIKTPLGRIAIRPNAKYTGRMKEPVTIAIFRNSLQGTVEQYSQMVKGDLVDQEADVIQLSINDVSVQRANDILNTVVAVYNEDWVEDKNKIAVATSQFITERLNVIEEELGHVDDDITEFKSANRLPDLEMAVRTAGEKGVQLDQTYLEASNQLAMVQYLRDFVDNPSHKYDVIPANVGIQGNDLSHAIGDYNTLLLQRDNILSNSSADNPLVKEMDVRLAGMRRSVQAALDANLGSLKANLGQIQKAKGSSDSELSSAPTKAKYLLNIERQQKVKEELYVFLLQKREENELNQTFTAYNTRVLNPPYGESAPVAPRKLIILFVCFVLGLAIPAIILYVVESTNTKVRSRKDLDTLLVPFAGEIPQVGKTNTFRNLFKSKKKKKAEIDIPKPVVAEGKRDVPNEAFRVVRSNLDFMLGRKPESTIFMLTSLNPGSGKSFIAYNLGASFVLKHKKVLLVDCDLRHGSLSIYAGNPRKGLSTYLTEHTDDWRKLLVHNAGGLDGLDIMPIGHKPPNPAELLENGRLARMLQEARQEYDIIMLDCPPTNIVVDTQIVEEYADRTIFVARAGLLERSAIPEIADLYKNKKFKHMVLLLNGTQTAFSSYYHYGNYESFAE